MLIGVGVYLVYKGLGIVFGRIGNSPKSWQREDTALVLANQHIKVRLGDKVTPVWSGQPVQKFINDEGCKAYSYSFSLRGTRGQVTTPTHSAPNYLQGEVLVERVKLPGVRGYNYRWLNYDDGKLIEVVPPTHRKRVLRKEFKECK